jgi:hypothetical protein
VSPFIKTTIKILGSAQSGHNIWALGPLRQLSAKIILLAQTQGT